MTGGMSLRGGPVGRWRLEHDGRLLEAETSRAGWERSVRLYADGEPAGEASGFTAVTVPFGDAAVRAVFDAVGLVDGQAARCELVLPRDLEREDAGDDGEPGDGAARENVPFTPPQGSRAARREALARAHPVLYASRHVVLAAGKVLFPLLGLSVLVRMLVELVPWPDVDLPKVSLPDVDLPGPPLPDVDLPDVSAPWWVQAILASAKFWGPLLVAVGVAAGEVSRRRRQRAEEDARRDGRPPGEGPPDERPNRQDRRDDQSGQDGDRRGDGRRTATRDGAIREGVGNRGDGG